MAYTNNQKEKYSQKVKYSKKETNSYKEDNGKYRKRRNDIEKEETKLVKKIIKSGCLVCQECKQCNGQQETYKANIARKQQKIATALLPYCEVEPMITMEKPYYYKNRVYRLFHHDRSGTPLAGYYGAAEGYVIKIDECYVDDKQCQKIIETVRGLLKSFKIKTFDLKTGHGLLRYVLVKRGLETNEIMVVLVLSSIIMPSKNNFVKELRRLHPDISTILINENYKDVNNIVGDREIAIYGKGFILDTFQGKKFRISSKSVFPVNPTQSKKVTDTIVKWGNLKGTELVLDVNANMGFHSMMLSDYARKIFSLETNHDMYRDILSNLKRNQIKNIDVYKKDAAEFIQQVVTSEKESIDIIVATQPYNGFGQAFIDAVALAKPKQLFYIAKNINSMLVELELLKKKGYRVEHAVAIDVLPWTDRFEIVVQLNKA